MVEGPSPFILGTVAQPVEFGTLVPPARFRTEDGAGASGAFREAIDAARSE